MSQGRNEGYYNNLNPIFSARILIPDPKIFRNFDPQTQVFETLIPDPTILEILIPFSMAVLRSLIPVL